MHSLEFESQKVIMAFAVEDATPEPPKFYSNNRQLFVSFTFLVIALLVLVMSMTAFVLREGITLRYEVFLEFIASVWVASAAIIVTLWLVTDDAKSMSPLDWQPCIRYGVFGTFVIALISVLAAFLIEKRVIPPNPAIAEIRASHGISLWMIAISVGILSPLGEELVFRRLLYNALRRGVGVWAAISISSVLFALYHMSISMLIPLFIASTVLTWMYQKTGRLIVSYTVHVVVNIGTVLVFLWKR